ncbi:MAG TPA: hypothetical protein VFL54_01885, partial [Gammaproteobacteria bacterium]|nr:hypothetical protein [Gammaproteobacteria bacterium]
AAIAIHVLSVVWWIGGLAMVTTVLLPAFQRDFHPAPEVALDYIERHFAPQARVAVILAGASGFYMLGRLHAWSWFTTASYWWLDAMAAYWLLFVLILFVVEPLGRRASAGKRTGTSGSHKFRRMQRVHIVLLLLGLLVIGCGVIGSRGVSF